MAMVDEGVSVMVMMSVSVGKDTVVVVMVDMATAAVVKRIDCRWGRSGLTDYPFLCNLRVCSQTNLWRPLPDALVRCICTPCPFRGSIRRRSW